MGPKSNVRHPYKEKVSGRQTDTEREEGHEGLPSGNVQWRALRDPHTMGEELCREVRPEMELRG